MADGSIFCFISFLNILDGDIVHISLSHFYIFLWITHIINVVETLYYQPYYKYPNVVSLSYFVAFFFPNFVVG